MSSKKFLEAKDFLDNRPKNVFPAVFMFFKLNILLFLGLLNMTTATVDRLVNV